MRFSWNWISDFVDLEGLPVQAVADRFTMTVAELEAVHHVGAGLEAVRVARIAALRPHPAAERLQVVDLDLGDRRVTGVSGAPNLAEGVLVPVALPGTTLPGGAEVRAVDLRGVRSEAVLLSEREMGLSDDHSGVLILPEGTPLGASLPAVLPVEDHVFEVDNKSLTHRPDLWGHLGLAREIAAMLGRPLRVPTWNPAEGPEDPIPVEVQDLEDCPRYMAQAYGGVRVLQSPFFVQRRLRAVGLRPINQVVDATNYVMLALGEPVHAFDRRRLHGGGIVVRRARPGEVLRLLDGRELRLVAEDLVIADRERPVALAGVMGGEESGIADDTTEVVLECATFHPARIRRAALRHGVRTDSSARFEKSLDPNLPPMAMGLFWELLSRWTPGARVRSRPADLRAAPREPLRITLDPAFVSRRLGVEVPPDRTRSILEHLGFDIAHQDGRFQVTVPSWRATKDVSIPEDLLEEVGRVIGYDQVPPAAPLAPVVRVPRQPRRVMARQIRHLLTAAGGLDEVMTYSFDSNELLSRLGVSYDDRLGVENPISQDFTHLRFSLLPNLLGVLERNFGRFPEAGVFEIGRVFRGTLDGEGIPIQATHLGLVLWRKTGKDAEAPALAYRRMKGILQHLFQDLGVGDPDLDSEWTGSRWPFMHPVSFGDVRVAGRSAGSFGLVHPATLATLDVKGVVAVAEVNLEVLLEAPRSRRAFQAISRQPAITADLSLVARRDLPYGALARAVEAGAGPFRVASELVGIYEGSPIPEGCRSITFRLTFQAPDRTLEETEVRQAMEAVVEEARKIGAWRWGDDAC